MKTSLPERILRTYAIHITLCFLSTSLASGQSGPGYALSFDGTDDWVDMSSAVIPTTGDFTVECWVYSAWPTNGYREILSQGSSGNALYIGIDPVHNFRFGDTWDTNVVAFPFGAWHHVALVKSSTKTIFFLDGTNRVTKTPAIANPAASSGFRLGRQYGGLAEYWFGRIDEVRIWSIARTGEEIAANMSRNLTGTEAGLLAYWRCNDSGTTLADATGHGFTGVLANGTSWVPSGIPFPPTASTAVAANVDVLSATLTGSANPRSLPATAWFEWGKTTNYGNVTSVTLLSATNGSLSVSTDLNGLTAGTTYHFRLIATNALGSAVGADKEFTTLLLPPTVESAWTTDISVFTATLAGNVNPNWIAGQAWFEWGTTTNYGFASAIIDLPATNTTQYVSAWASKLTPGTLYHFRLVATNSAGRTEGEDSLFITPLFSDINAGLPEVTRGSVAWGDYNNDDRLDVVISGDDTNYNPICRIYRNDGNGTFTDINAGLPGVLLGSVAWGDYNNDGRLDLLLTGDDGTKNSIACIYRNNGDGTFTDIKAGLLGVVFGSVAWGDYNNDGWLDCLLTGLTLDSQTNYIPGARVYQNNGNGTFTDINAQLPGVAYSSVAWGDYDNDGRLDILLTGANEMTNHGVASFISSIYHNNGNGTFTDINAGLPGILYGSVAWFDYNNDGRLDFLLTGSSEYTSNTIVSVISRIYRNEGNGAFTDINAQLPGLAYSSSACGDYDSDGLQDILLTGRDADSIFVTHLCRNNGDDTFRGARTTGLPNVTYGSVTWGDYNSDGRLDALLTGRTDIEFSPREYLRRRLAPGLYQNWCAVTNTLPSAPTGLRSIVSSSVVSLSWQPAGDAQTPTPGLTYNLRVGTTPGGCDVVSPQSNPTNGVRRLSGMGNVQHGTNAMLVTLGSWKHGLHYWSVQAVDSAGTGSPFAAEGTFRVPAPPDAVTLSATDISSHGATLHGSVCPNLLPTLAWFEWGSTTDGGNFTPVLMIGDGADLVPMSYSLDALQPAVTYYYRLVGYNHLSATTGEEQSFTTPDVPRTLSGRSLGPLGPFQLQFAGAPGASYRVLVSTNLTLPSASWRELGTPAEVTPGQFEFTDTESPASPERFYRLRWP